jgi:two-component system sensor histidine kinase CpxA
MDLSGPREFLSAAKGFNSMVKQISEMIANRERLLRDMSHEFRSPLARIKLALGMMSESDEKKSIEEDILEMENLVTDILEAYKYAENHKSGSALIFKKSWEVFNLRDLVTFQVEKIRRTYNNTSFIEIQNQEKIYINGEKEKIKSLLGNLLENAVKHNPPGGNVTINLKQGIELNKAILEVSDEGKGVSEDLRDKIFDPFYRIEESRTRGSGYGLGLFLCREIALAHGGDISASANIPKGTVFTVKIPLANTP